MKKALLVIALAAAASPALSHVGGAPGHHAGSGLAAGFGHPFGGLDHLLAMLAIGVWSASALPLRQSWIAPLGFVAAMLAGAGIAFAGVPLPGVETMIAVSVLLSGLLVAIRLPLPAVAGAAVAAAFAVFHGHAHGIEAAGGVAAYMAGFAAATALLHLLGIGVGLLLARSRMALAALGSATALAGAAMLS